MLQIKTGKTKFNYLFRCKYIANSKILLVNLHPIMKSQHQVILSIGSNLGNRLENIERSLELIHQEVGTIIKVSDCMKRLLGVLKVMLLQLCAGFAYFSSAQKKSSFKIEKRLGRLK
jgi:biotin-(acetyl-CoA carboxylase) ligase